MAESFLQILLILIFPYLAIRGAARFRVLEMISPIILCFAVGILVCNFGILSINSKISSWFRDLTILFALPLLLYSADIRSWIKNARRLLIAFSFCLIGGMLASLFSAFVYRNEIDAVWIPAGMMVGIYSGGTPNLFAVGYALGARDEVFTLLNAAEVFWGAVYLLFLLSVGKVIFRKVLTTKSLDHNLVDDSGPLLNYSGINWTHSLMAIFFTLFLMLLCVGSSMLFFGSLREIWIVVSLTVLAIISSFSPRVRSWKGTFEMGDYFLLMFGVAVGLVSDFGSLLSEGRQYILFVFLILILTLVIQLMLSKLFKIDGDSYMVSGTAGLYGPVFIPLIVNNLKNKSLLVGGIALSLLGLAIGNFLGIAVGYIAQFLLN